MEAALIQGRVSRLCEILGLEVFMIALFDVANPQSIGCTAQTDLANIWYFPQTNEIHFFTVDDGDTIDLRNAIFLAENELEIAIPGAKATIEQVRFPVC
jgi:hypothetical protein